MQDTASIIPSQSLAWTKTNLGLMACLKRLVKYNSCEFGRAAELYKNNSVHNQEYFLRVAQIRRAVQRSSNEKSIHASCRMKATGWEGA